MPFVTEMSANSNSLTFSENLMFTLNLPVAGKPPELLSATVGPESAATSVSSSLDPKIGAMSDVRKRAVRKVCGVNS